MRLFAKPIFASLLILSLHTSYAQAAEATAPVTHAELGGLIREYLMDHPEVIVDALEAMQKKEMERAASKASEAVVANKKIIYDDAFTPVIGAKNAPLTIVEFSDYNCSACKFMFGPLERLMKEDNGKVRLLIKEFPIFGAQSEALAALGLAAYQIDKDHYVEFHSAMMKSPGHVTEAKVDATLTEAGYTPQEVRARAAKDDIKKALARTQALGEAMAIRGTPTLIVGDEVVPHALDFDGLSAKVAEQLKK